MEYQLICYIAKFIFFILLIQIESTSTVPLCQVHFATHQVDKVELSTSQDQCFIANSRSGHHLPDRSNALQIAPNYFYSSGGLGRLNILMK